MVTQERPRYEWTVLHDFWSATDAGNNNAGIQIVRNDESGIIHLFKRFAPLDIKQGYAQRELEALQRLQHPNITKLCDFYIRSDRAEGGIYMEYCEEGSLANLIRKLRTWEQPISEDYAWHIFRSLVSAVDHCHRANGPQGWTVHLDIKPSNIFLSFPSSKSNPFPRVVLGDFGNCKTRLSVHEEFRKYGDSANYMEYQDIEFRCPESPKFGLESDIYQIGLVMHAICNLVDHPDTKKYWNLADANLLCKPAFERVLETSTGPNYSPELRELVKQCLQLDPTHRPSARELSEKM